MTSHDLTLHEASFRAVTYRNSNQALHIVIGTPFCVVCLLAKDGSCVQLEKLKIILHVFIYSTNTIESIPGMGKAAVNLKVRIPTLEGLHHYHRRHHHHHRHLYHYHHHHSNKKHTSLISLGKNPNLLVDIIF